MGNSHRSGGRQSADYTDYADGKLEVAAPLPLDTARGRLSRSGKRCPLADARGSDSGGSGPLAIDFSAMADAEDQDEQAVVFDLAD